jgi:glyoxylase-like metal-dependent hydrolase (beta-lactamase superfamily II)
VSDARRIRCLTTGSVRAKQGDRGVSRYLLNRWRDDARPVHAFLIEHPEGLCLFDAGQTVAAARPHYFPWWHPFFRLSRFELTPDDELAQQLGGTGAGPRALRWVVLSHLHTDHVGCLGDLRSDEVLVSRTEWERARGVPGRIRGYVPQHWPRNLVPRLIDFDGPPVGPFAGSYDLAGDGRLVFLPAPGHTPGHAVLLVRDEEATWLCGGDLAHTWEELESVAPEVAAFCRREGVRFLGAHDPAAPSLIGDISARGS